jgi:hypothetical protein
MADVYQNAMCNIVSAKVSSEDGMFAVRDPFTLSLDLWSDWDELTPSEYCIVAARIWKENFALMPIHERGWILQERLLSPRVLYFADDQLYWECCELDASESFPTGIPSEIRGHDFYPNFKNTLSIADS